MMFFATAAFIPEAFGVLALRIALAAGGLLLTMVAVSIDKWGRRRGAAADGPPAQASATVPPFTARWTASMVGGGAFCGLWLRFVQHESTGAALGGSMFWTVTMALAHWAISRRSR